ncbi:MAG: TetR/AcrR family transcriptional regulator [Treponema sp.]|nr:TetR/AcrR family transcriptional regulator [Treponema sp.]
MTKAEIIDAAFKVWGRNYYRKTSLSQLAAELKVCKPALYRHFFNKQALTKAMAERFFDDFAAFIKVDLNKALDEDVDEGISSILKSISCFFAGNVNALIFSLINLYDRSMDSRTITDSMKSRGADIGIIQMLVEKKYSCDPILTRLIFATLTFLMSHYHMVNKSMENPPSEAKIKDITCLICNTINSGLGYSSSETEIDFEKLEKQVEGMPLNAEPEMFFKAVAEAVAQAGPWDVSMNMVAKKLGLSKSSLYVHFKNKKDMLRRLFITEFKNIIVFTKQGISLSSNTSEQLYLGIYTISVYLRARPEVLVAMDWIRTRKLELGKPDKNLEIFRLFEDVDIKLLQGTADDEKQRTSHWILFLLVNVLISMTLHKTQNNCIRILFKFIFQGLGGFKK